MTRTKASAIHLGISSMIVGLVFAVIFFVWYPGATFSAAGALKIVLVLILVDLVLGPLLTLIIYKQGKRGLRFDLWFIATIQVVALVYGSTILYLQRPYYMVFVVDRINLVAEKHIDKSKIRFDELLEKPFADVIKVFARMPEGDEFQKFQDSVLFEGLADLEGRPEFWEPYANGKQTIVEAIKPLAELKRQSERDERLVQRAIDKFGADHADLGVLPIGILEEDVGMLMDSETTEPLDVIRVDPW